MLTVGMYLADRYEIVGKVGAGGMSDVYKAKDHILGRFVAVKVLKNEFSEDRTFVTKFRTEAQSAAGLEHPNIVNIYDVGSEEGLHFIVMEYVEGVTLKTYIEKKGQLTFKESVSIAIQVAKGIEAAHNKNIIHRDIKPQNIIISTEGKVKVTDFGIAKAASSNTISSDVMGSVHYASPEQARNGFVDGRSDIYSLGIVMYEMVTGRVPFDGDTTVAVAIQHLQEEMVNPKKYAEELPVSLEKIILKCTQKNPDRRYQTIAELVGDLRKSFTNPDEDFVVIAPLVDNAKTKVIGSDDLDQIMRTNAAESSAKLSEQMNQSPKQTENDLDFDKEGEGDLLNPKLDKAVTIASFVMAGILIIAVIAIIIKIATTINGGSHKNTETETQTQTESQTADEVTMIDLVGMTKDEASKAVSDIGLSMYVSSVEESDKADDTVLSQSVEAGEVIASGSIISVTVAGDSSNAADNVTVPNIVGMSEENAITMLSNNNLDSDKTYEYSSEVAAGQVIRQEPTAGSTAAKNSKVVMVISQGIESVEVPNVTGKTEEKAKAAIEKAGLVAAVESDYSDTVAEGSVISQSIAGGKQVEGGSTVTITVSLGAKTPTYTYSQEFEVPEGATYASYTLYDANENVISSQTAAVHSTSITIQWSKGITTSTGSLELLFTIDNGDGSDPTTVTGFSGTVSFNEQ